MKTSTKAVLSLIVISALYGLMYPMVQLGLAHCSPALYLTLKAGIGLVALVPFCYKSFKKVTWRCVGAGTALGLLSFGGNFLQTQGLALTTATNSAFLSSLNVIFVPLVASLLRKKAPSVRVAACALLSLAGSAIICEAVGFSGGRVYWNLSAVCPGDWITILGALCLSLMMIMNARVCQSFDIRLLCFAQVFVCFLLSFLSYALKPGGTCTLTAELIVSLLYCGAVVGAGCFLWLLWSQKHVEASTCAIIIAAQAVFTAGFAAVIRFGGMSPVLPGVPVYLGGGLILASIAICNLTKKE